MKTMIAIPCLDKIDTEFVKCLMALQPVGLVTTQFAVSSLVYDSRERLAERAVAEKTDYVLWLDSDMTFNQTFLADLMNNEKDICCGLFFKRRYPYDPAIYKKIRMGIGGDSIAEGYDDYPKDQVFEIDACGFAGVLVKTEVIEAVLKEFKTAFIPLPGYGEDISFCIRAKKLGYKIFCDSRAKMGHLAISQVTEETYDAIRSKEK